MVEASELREAFHFLADEYTDLYGFEGGFRAAAADLRTILEYQYGVR